MTPSAAIKIWFSNPIQIWIYVLNHLVQHRGHVSIEFWITSIVVTATPGTGALFTIAAGLARGARAGAVAAFGCTLGIVPHLTLAVSGAAALLAASPAAFETIKWLGVGYLLYMAWGTWRQAGILAPVDAPEASQSPMKVIGSAVLVNLLNPKLTLFFFVFLPMFVDTTAPGAMLRLTALGATFMVITLAIFTAYAICAAWLRQYVIGRPTVMLWMSRAFAASFVGLALLLALTRHQS